MACNSNQKLILTQEFPELSYFELEGYQLHFGKNAWKTIVSVIFQVPKILTKINRENRWLRRFLAENKVDLVFSDNRYGFHSDQKPSIFITHQLAIRSGIHRRVDLLLQRLNYRYINRFTNCWVPDYADGPNLAGELSHPSNKPAIACEYIGALSRFEATTTNTPGSFVLIILSGPEPQRSILENRILSEIAHLTGRFVLVRGLPGISQVPSLPKNIEVHNHLPAAKLNQLMCNCSFVISRAGYTSIMDYFKTNARAILIPTPGQAEQEYLAAFHHRQQSAMSVNQEDFSIEGALKSASVFPFENKNWDMDRYKQVIDDLLLKHVAGTLKHARV